MPTHFEYDVFLSHNSKDKVRVRRLAERSQRLIEDARLKAEHT